jgi:tRNA nucleotidyltransferase (CCA-adding enzyme)
LAEHVCRLHLLAHTALQLRPNTILELFEKLDAFRKPDRLRQFLLVCEADKRGRLGLQDAAYPSTKYLLELFHKANSIRAQALLDSGLRGAQLGAAPRAARLRAVSDGVRQLRPGGSDESPSKSDGSGT